MNSLELKIRELEGFTVIAPITGPVEYAFKSRAKDSTTINDFLKARVWPLSPTARVHCVAASDFHPGTRLWRVRQIEEAIVQAANSVPMPGESRLPGAPLLVNPDHLKWLVEIASKEVHYGHSGKYVVAALDKIKPEMTMDVVKEIWDAMPSNL